jgi:TetR/AcrR family transcriptional regulator, mexJK operon transcriptional repressor
MSSVRPEIKESFRSRDSVPDADQEVAIVRNVGALIRSLSEHRSKPKAKEQEVLDVATAYFLKHGYQGASINAMARSSGISKESIYRYFSSKKQLFEAVMCRELVEYQESLRRLSAAKTMDLREALITVAETVLGVVTTDRTLALRRLIFDEARRSPDIGQHYYKIGPESGVAALEEIFKSHRTESDFDLTVLSRHFCAMIAWRVMLERECAVIEAPTGAEMRRLVELVVDDFMKAFLRSK